RLMTNIKMEVPVSDARTLKIIYENGLVTAKSYKDDLVYIEARLPIRIANILGYIG
ncbi:MAG: hypothetical protein HZA72_02355, partial [Candidatus Omnitrophica bacterium]|nr:hypothetical protein [Candidatus Omnitrophota bacterium]